MASRCFSVAVAFGVAGAVLVAASTAGRAQPYSNSGFEWPSEWMVGGFVYTQPKFEGSKDYTVFGAPFIAPGSFAGSSGFVNIIDVENVQFRLLRFGYVEAGPLVGYRFGRDEDDSVRLHGLGDIDGGIVVGGYLALGTDSLRLRASYNQQVTGDDTGYTLRIDAETEWKLSPVLTARARAGVTYASDDYMSAFFGVTPVQSLASGLVPFDAGAGIKDVHVGLTFDYELSREWLLRLSGNYKHLVGDAADSPIVETRNQFTGLVGLAYRFHWNAFGPAR